jgi:prophage tail gpP-like protein
MAAVTLIVEGRELETPMDYSVDIDLLTPSDSLEFTLPLDAETLSRVPLDGEVQFVIDDAVVFTGYVETVAATPESTIRVTALDKCGRLVAESVDGAGFSAQGRGMREAIELIAGPWFPDIVFSNAEDRRLRLGRGSKARTGTEPALTFRDALESVQYIEAGTTRWEALERILRAFQLLAWSSGDGSTLVVARPNYDQEPQYELFETRAVSNVKSMSFAKSNAGRYAQIEVSGSGFPPGIPPPPRVQVTPGVAAPRFVSHNNLGVIFDGPNGDGTGGDFLRPKRLFVVSEALNRGEAQIEAERYLSRSRAKAREITVTAADHGQVREGTQYRTLYTTDTVSRIYKTIDAAPGDDAEAELVNASFYCTQVTHEGSRDTEETTLHFVPMGTLLT